MSRFPHLRTIHAAGFSDAELALAYRHAMIIPSRIEGLVCRRLKPRRLVAADCR